MSLEVVKELFEEVTGRHDLVISTNNVNAVWLINQGIRWLEKTYPLKNTSSTYKVDLAADTWYIRLNHCQTITSVWVTDSDKDRTKLEVRSKSYMLSNYGEEFGELDTGKPIDYCPTVNRAALSTQTSTYDSYASDLTSMKDYNGLIVLPPADETYSLLIEGEFFSEDLVDDDDENFWTENCPMATALAASLMLDFVYRGKEGASAGKSNIYDLIEGDLKNVVWEEAATADQGKG